MVERTYLNEPPLNIEHLPRMVQGSNIKCIPPMFWQTFGDFEYDEYGTCGAFSRMPPPAPQQGCCMPPPPQHFSPFAPYPLPQPPQQHCYHPPQEPFYASQPPPGPVYQQQPANQGRCNCGVGSTLVRVPKGSQPPRHHNHKHHSHHQNHHHHDHQNSGCNCDRHNHHHSEEEWSENEDDCKELINYPAGDDKVVPPPFGYPGTTRGIWGNDVETIGSKSAIPTKSKYPKESTMKNKKQDKSKPVSATSSKSKQKKLKT